MNALRQCNFHHFVIFFNRLCSICEQNFSWNFRQALLKIMAADSFRVAKAIKILLGCSSKQSNENESTLHGFPSANLKELIFDNCGSHLVEASP